ncbi:hypothetical protein D3C71_1778060 [compost metagenome]
MTGETVKNVLAFTTGGDQSFIAQDPQLLGQGRLAHAGHFFQFAYVAFALGQLAQDQQAILIGQGLEQRTGLGGRGAQLGDFTFGQTGLHLQDAFNVT